MKYEDARKNMVDSQIHTAGVILPAVLKAFETTPREVFVPEDYKGVAYKDEDLKLGQGRFLLEPIVHSKMLQALEPDKSHAVLDIGCATGYSSAILAQMTMTVVALEENNALLGVAAKNWKSLGLTNIAAFEGTLNKGHALGAPYDLIMINGAVSEVPQGILNQLAPQGRLVTIIKKPGGGLGSVTLIQNIGKNSFSSYTLFQSGSHFLPGFEAAPAFSF